MKSPCRYDWAPGHRGQRLQCVVHCHKAASDTVFARTNCSNTLAEMLKLGVLVGQALMDATRLKTGFSK
jgi:hypothetical protein